MESIQLNTKELQSKMYLTETHRLIGFIKEAIGSLCGGTWTTFRVERNQFLQLSQPLVGSYEDSGQDPIRILGRILSGSWVGSYQDPG